MKRIKRILAGMLALALAVVLCACSGDAQTQEDTGEGTVSEAQALSQSATSEASEEAEEPEEAASPAPAEVELPTEGVYKLFAVQRDGFLVEAKAMESGSVLTLEENGGGSLTMESPDSNQTLTLTSWTVENDQLTLSAEDGSTASGKLGNGVVELDIFGTGDMILYYAMEGVNLSNYQVLNKEEYQQAYDAAHDSRLYALWKSLDTEKGVHLRYRVKLESMDIPQDYDVHGKGGNSYSLRTTEVSGRVIRAATLYQDGTAYNLQPDENTGRVVTTTTMETLLNNAMMTDALYRSIATRSQEWEYTKEERERKGKTYSVEVFPGSEYQGETAFYYDADGHLKYCVEGASEATKDLGGTTYTVEEIDDSVDESLFDLSGYDISKE